MVVSCACKYLKACCRLITDLIVRKHSLYCKLHSKLGLCCHKGLVLNFLKTADITGMVTVVLLIKLLTCKYCLFSIDDDYKLTTVNVGGKLRAVLTAKIRRPPSA